MEIQGEPLLLEIETIINDLAALALAVAVHDEKSLAVLMAVWESKEIFFEAEQLAFEDLHVLPALVA